MAEPICPRHNRVMQLSRGGEKFFCTAKDATGPRGYCTYTAPVPAQAAPEAATARPPAPAPATLAAGPDGDKILMGQCIRAAAQIWGQVPMDMHVDVINTAVQFYRAARAVTG